MWPNNWMKDYETATPEQKLQIIRNEAARDISVIRGFTSAIKQKVETDEDLKADQDLISWLDRILESANELNEMIKSITSVKSN